MYVCIFLLSFVLFFIKFMVSGGMKVQSGLAQANYFRDPLKIDEYKAGDEFLVEINNERTTDNRHSTMQ